MSKIIQFDESLFQLSSNKTRKKKATNNDDIKVRERKQRPETLKRRQFLKYFRDRQEENYKKLVNNDPHLKQSQEDFKKPFDDTLSYLMDLVEKENAKQQPTLNNNHSVKRPIQSHVNENVSLEMPSTLQNVSSSFVPPPESPSMQLSTPVKSHSPTWGCLKNGSLPTYRNWKNQTQKLPIQEPVTLETINPVFGSRPVENNVLREIQEKRALTNSLESSKNAVKLYYPKQKRVVRRTYKVGRSKYKPNVSILVSNRTMRNRISTESQQLKQIPIQEVRKYLVKKGFIRVGSSSPNDVLRKMYETAKLMCGEMENHNPDNLLYNYFHDQEDVS